MKQPIFYILILLLLSCCTDTTIDSRLGYANDLATRGDLDSAQIVISQIEPNGLNNYNRHFHNLITIKLHDKSYQDITADTIIHEIIGFFEHNGEKDVLGEAYYYGGRVCRERGDAPQALDYFQKAFDTVEENNLTLKGKASSQMGQLFLALHMYELAKPKFQEAINYNVSMEDSIALMYNFCSLADTYKSLNQPDSAYVYYNKSITFAHIICPLSLSEVETRAALINLYIQNNDFNNALDEFYKLDIRDTNKISNYIIMTMLNCHILQKDYQTVEKISKDLIINGNLKEKMFAYNTLANLAKYKNQINDLHNYIVKYKECLDSINCKTSQEAIIHQNSFYNYAVKERENKNLKQETHRLYFIIMCGIVLLAIIIFVLLCLIERHKTIKKLLAIQLSKIEQLNIAYNNIKSTSDSENYSIPQLKQEIRNKYLERIRNVDTKGFSLSEDLVQSAIYKKLIDIINTSPKFEETDWLELERVICTIYPNFKNSLYLLCETLSSQEFRICILIKCKIGTTNIGKILFKDKTTISSAKKRLFKKFFCESGSAIEFDMLIYSL